MNRIYSAAFHYEIKVFTYATGPQRNLMDGRISTESQDGDEIADINNGLAARIMAKYLRRLRAPITRKPGE